MRADRGLVANDIGTIVASVDADGAGATVDAPLLVLVGLILLLPLLSMVLLSALAVRRDRRGERASPVATTRPTGGEDTARPTVDLQLVAVDATTSTFVIDGVVVRHGSPLAPVGWPVTYRVRRPQSRDLDLAILAMLTRWAAEDEVVGFATTGTEPRRRVSITYGPSILHLDADPVGSRDLRP